MDKDTLESNSKIVKELILDEQKLVTYVSVSKELCIHVNEAKCLLNHIIEDIRQSQPKTELNVCYLISGLLNNNNACTTVCSETDIEALKKTLKSVFYEHVYCVSCGVQGVDNVALTSVNQFEDIALCAGLIKSHTCLKRTNDEIGNLKFNSNHGITNEAKPISIIKKTPSETPKEVVTKEKGDIKKVKSEPALKSNSPSPKIDGSSHSNKLIDRKNVNKPATKGIAGFFNKANGDSNKVQNIKVKEEKKIDESKTKVIKEIKVKDEPVTDGEIPHAPEKNGLKAKKSNEKSISSLNQIKKNAKVDKKRKRVLHVSDSESETETNDPFADDDNKMVIDHESEDEIPPTPSANTVKITSGIVNPKKRRKIVDKTYTDEEGYILTKKVEVYESCSDTEMETKENIKKEKENVEHDTQVKTDTSPKENIKTKKKKVSPPQKGKQQTLMSFFKKV